MVSVCLFFLCEVWKRHQVIYSDLQAVAFEFHFLAANIDSTEKIFLANFLNEKNEREKIFMT